jgi:hypothetical protein
VRSLLRIRAETLAAVEGLSQFSGPVRLHLASGGGAARPERRDDLLGPEPSSCRERHGESSSRKISASIRQESRSGSATERLWCHRRPSSAWRFERMLLDSAKPWSFHVRSLSGLPFPLEPVRNLSHEKMSAGTRPLPPK